ncbi:unnamed protein product [Oncorhynchus mykiss]|uniref:Uncharacterized protein n=1 Tax=Oncorhynchus mykiss TaxID=8022 RepID=A0A060XUZ3_ONCMY|nr:unnamed protein product [Oncorhynchus mykiss]
MCMWNMSIYLRKNNTVAAEKECELARSGIFCRVNACDPTGTKCTWQQLNMKYKNFLQTDLTSIIANTKKAEGRKTGGGPQSKQWVTYC